jgi:hypothetical protein
MIKSHKKHRIDPAHYLRADRERGGWYSYEVLQIPEFDGRKVFSCRCRATRIADVIAHAAEELKVVQASLAKRSQQIAPEVEAMATVGGAAAPGRQPPAGSIEEQNVQLTRERRIVTIVIDELRCGHVVTIDQLHALVLTHDKSIALDELRKALGQLTDLRIVDVDADEVGQPLRYRWWR